MSDQARDMMAKIDRGIRLESAPEMTGETLISVPTELLPAVRELIVRHQRSA